MKYVYMLRVGDNHYKIGIATNVSRRVKELQTSNPNKIVVVMSRLIVNSYQVESEIHDILAELKAGGGKEWFVLTPSQAIDISIRLNDNPEFDLSDQITHQKLFKLMQESYADLSSKVETITSRYQKILDLDIAVKETKKADYERRKLIKRTPGLLDDETYDKAMEVCLHEGKASASLLQRHLSIGYARAARIIERLEKDGYVGPADGARPREVYEWKLMQRTATL